MGRERSAQPCSRGRGALWLFSSVRPGTHGFEVSAITARARNGSASRCHEQLLCNACDPSVDRRESAELFDTVAAPQRACDQGALTGATGHERGPAMQCSASTLAAVSDDIERTRPSIVRFRRGRVRRSDYGVGRPPFVALDAQRDVGGVRLRAMCPAACSDRPRGMKPWARCSGLRVAPGRFVAELSRDPRRTPSSRAGRRCV